jgi:hypothetical protein
MIIASAIRLNGIIKRTILGGHRGVNKEEYINPIVAGKRHTDAEKMAYELFGLDATDKYDIKIITNATHGFLTCKGKFLNRIEAKKYAIKHQQYRADPKVFNYLEEKIKNGESLYNGPELFSEDLW